MLRQLATIACLCTSMLAAGCTGDPEPPPPDRPALPADQIDPCLIVSIVDIATLTGAENINPRRMATSGQPATCEFNNTRNGQAVTATVAVSAATALQAPAGATPLPDLGDGARSAMVGTTWTAQVWLADVGVQLKLDGAGAAAPDPGPLKAVLDTAVKRLTSANVRLTDTGPYVGFGNPACALLHDEDVDAHFGAEQHDPPNGSRVSGEYSCAWFQRDGARTADTLATNVDPPVTPEAFDK